MNSPDSTPQVFFQGAKSGTWDFLIAEMHADDNQFVDFLGLHLNPQGRPEDKCAFINLIILISGFHLKDDADDIFGPSFQINDRRSLIPSDLHDDAFRVLSAAFPSCPHADLKGRMGEVLWHSAKHLPEFKAVRFGWVTETVAALQLLVEQVLAQSTPNQMYCNIALMRLRRACRLVLGVSNRNLTQNFGQWLLALRATCLSRGNASLVIDVLSIELEFAWTSPATCLAEARQVSQQQLTLGNHLVATDGFDLALNAAHKTNDPNLVKAAHLERAAAQQALATAYQAASPDAVAPAVGALNKAMTSLRAAGADKASIDPLQKELRRLNQRLVDSAGTISLPLDLTDMAEKLDRIYDQSTLQESLHLLLFGVLTPKGYRESRERMQQRMRETVFLSFMPITKMTRDGRVEGVAGPITGDGNEGRLYLEIGQQQGLDGLLLRVVRSKFLEHHPFDLRLCEDLVCLSPVVPLGRKKSVARGIFRGWQGEWSDALHLLIPQVENILRTHLDSIGVVITKSNPQKQHVIDLGEMLTEHEALLAKSFGEGVILALRSACTENIGRNRRNDLSHGLIDDNEFNDPADLYLWWLIMRLVFWPVFHQEAPDFDHRESATPPPEATSTDPAGGQSAQDQRPPSSRSLPQ